ncbi:MAG: class I SAM-dependent methyltransferase, partial [Tepidiformaceae bacterium]
MPAPYAVDARYYDLIHGREGADIGLWLSFAGRTDRPVLEIGTGTGRIALALARAGHAVTAIDPSPAMLAVAREHADADAVDDVTFIEGLPTALVLEPGHYGLVLLPADVFLYCTDGDDQLATLRAVGGALAFNGVLALDLPGPAAWLDPTSNGQPLLAFSGALPGGEWLDAWHVHEDDLARQSRLLRITYESTAADGVVRREASEHR